MTSHTPLGQSGIQINKYLTALNANCPVLDGQKVNWTSDDLQPMNIREYCKVTKDGARLMCWSCSDYIAQYKAEIAKWEQGPGAVMGAINELKQLQAEMDAKLSRILTLLETNLNLVQPGSV